MPTPGEILALLTTMANQLAPLAMAWHLAVVAVAVALLVGWRPSTRLGVLFVVAPALSVSIASLRFGNPFNGLSFVILAGVLAALGGTTRARPTSPGPVWAVSLGIALIVYGMIYPHFVAGSWTRMLLAAPVGLVPCPTLAVMAGFTLVAGGFRQRAFSAVLAGWTAFYALFGIVQLGVVLDAGLVVAGIGLVAMSVHNARGSSRLHPASVGSTR